MALIESLGKAIGFGAQDFISGFAGSASSSLLGMRMSDYNAQRMFELNEKAAENAYKRQLDFWNLQNQYNSPSAQMQRLRAAGLNPALMNGIAQNNTAGNLSSVPEGGASQSPSYAPNPIQQMMPLASAIKELESAGLLEEETRLTMEKIVSESLEQFIKSAVGADAWAKANQSIGDFVDYLSTRYPNGDIPDFGEFFVPKEEPKVSFSGLKAEGMQAENALKKEQAETEQQKQANLEALTLTENTLRDISYEQMQQQVSESKARVNQLDADAKRLIREAEHIENLVEREDIVNAAAAFYGVPLDNLPSTLQYHLIDLWHRVVKGDLMADTALRIAPGYVNDYRTKELHIPRTRSWSESLSKSSGIGIFKKSHSESYGWTETY